MSKLKTIFQTWIFYPLLFAANEILTLAAPNLANVPLNEAWLLILVMLTAILLLIIALRAWLKNWHRAGLLALLVVFWFGHYGLFFNMALPLLKQTPSLHLHILAVIAWTLPFALLGSPWIWRKVTSPHTITTYLNLLMFILLGISIYNIYDFESRRINSSSAKALLEDLPVLQGEQRPDIYYIITDAYGRQDTLQSLYGFDNSAFINFLEQRGFIIADQSYTNYGRTALSLSASLNFSYLPEMERGSGDQRPLQELVLKNRLMRTLENHGYTTIAFASGYFLTNMRTAQQYISASSSFPTKFLAGLYWTNSLALLPIQLNWIPSPLQQNRDLQNMLVGQVEQMKTVAAAPGPKFVFLHLMIPHPPFIFDHNGPIDPDSIYLLNDAESFRGQRADYLSGYTEQIQYTNQLLMQFIAVIQDQSATPPIIILQGDHGPGAYLDRRGIAYSCLQERYAILNAYYLPGSDAPAIYAEISPVNTFRLILDAYFETNLGLLAEESFFSTELLPYDLENVTTQSRQPCLIP